MMPSRVSARNRGEGLIATTRESSWDSFSSDASESTEAAEETAEAVADAKPTSRRPARAGLGAVERGIADAAVADAQSNVDAAAGGGGRGFDDLAAMELNNAGVSADQAGITTRPRPTITAPPRPTFPTRPLTSPQSTAPTTPPPSRSSRGLHHAAQRAAGAGPRPRGPCRPARRPAVGRLPRDDQAAQRHRGQRAGVSGRGGGDAEQAARAPHPARPNRTRAATCRSSCATTGRRPAAG